MSLFGRNEKKGIERIRAQMSPDQVKLESLNAEIQRASEQLAQLRKQVEEAKGQLVETDEAVLLQSYGMYTPHYSYSTSDEYKEKIAEIRNQQKAAIKSGKAVFGNENWTVNGNSAKGKKMVHDMQKLLLRAYNAECDDAIEHVRFNNIEACTKKIHASADAISKLGSCLLYTSDAADEMRRV